MHRVFRVRVVAVRGGFMVWHGGHYVGASMDLSAAHTIATKYAFSAEWLKRDLGLIA